MVQDAIVSGPWEELDEVFEKLRTIVIPRVLDPLVADGRKLKPCLVHGNVCVVGGLCKSFSIFDAVQLY